MISLLSKILVITLYFGVVSPNNNYVTVECVDKCTVTGSYINGGEGDTITLKYIINTFNFVSLELYYDKTNFLQVSSKQIYKKDNCPSFINVNKTLINTTYGYSFSFKIMNLTKTMQRKTTNYDLSFPSSRSNEKNSSTINVQYGPKLLGRWMSSYEVQENNTVDVNVTISGNPKPNVTARIESKHFVVNSSSVESPYKYNAILKHVKISQCGRNLTLKAVGYNRISFEYTANINVIFTPGIPKISYATITRKNCLHVAWNKIESGACHTTYTLYCYFSRGTNNVIKFSTFSLQYKHCFDSTYQLLSVNIQAKVGKSSGSFSQRKKVVLEEKNGDDNHTIIIIIIVVIICILAAIDIAVLVFVREKEKFKYIGIPLTVIGIPILAMYFIIQKLMSGRGTGWVAKQQPADAYVISASVVRQDGEMKGSFSQPKNVELEINHSAGEYARVGNIEQVNNHQPTQEMDYAILGPGGRTGEKTLVEPSLYAEVNTDATFYPPLNPNNEGPPEYAVSSKARNSSPSTQGRVETEYT